MQDPVATAHRFWPLTDVDQRLQSNWHRNVADEHSQIGDRQSAIGNAKSVECVPNFSEGRKIEVVERLAGAIAGVETACVLDTHMDPDHNRSVITFVAAPERVVEAAVQVVALAAESDRYAAPHWDSIRGSVLRMSCRLCPFAE